MSDPLDGAHAHAGSGYAAVPPSAQQAAAGASSYPSAEEAYAMAFGGPSLTHQAAQQQQQQQPAYDQTQQAAYYQQPSSSAGAPASAASAAEEDDGGDNPTIYIQGLPASITEEELVAFFGSIGLVRMVAGKGKDRTKKAKCWIYRDKQTGQPKGDVSSGTLWETSTV